MKNWIKLPTLVILQLILFTNCISATVDCQKAESFNDIEDGWFCNEGQFSLPKTCFKAIRNTGWDYNRLPTHPINANKQWFWHNATDECYDRYGTTLASIRYSDDNNKALAAMRWANCSTAWMGMYDITGSSSYKWIDGTIPSPIDFTNWRDRNSPNSYYDGIKSVGYIELYEGDAFEQCGYDEWKDAYSDSAKQPCGICYKRFTANPTPSPSKAPIASIPTVPTTQSPTSKAPTTKAPIPAPQPTDKPSFAPTGQNDCVNAEPFNDVEPGWFCTEGHTALPKTCFKAIRNTGWDYNRLPTHPINAAKQWFWDNATDECHDKYGTTLASIISTEDNNKALAAMRWSNCSTAWMGMYDITGSSSYKWIDGRIPSPIDFTNWKDRNDPNSHYNGLTAVGYIELYQSDEFQACGYNVWKDAYGDAVKQPCGICYKRYTAGPTRTQTNAPTLSPTTREPTTRSPTSNPTPSPTLITGDPTRSPTTREPTTRSPTTNPTPGPVPEPTVSPTTREPTTRSPTTNPTPSPTSITDDPTRSPTTREPTTRSPTTNPTPTPTSITGDPTISPTTKQPTTRSPTINPTTKTPTTRSPTTNPTPSPVPEPTVSPTTKTPTTRSPTTNPTPSPTSITGDPTISPTTKQPTTRSPTTNPTPSPTSITDDPTLSPTTKTPTTRSPTSNPTPAPTPDPTSSPTPSPTSITTSPTTMTPTSAPSPSNECNNAPHSGVCVSIPSLQKPLSTPYSTCWGQCIYVSASSSCTSGCGTSNNPWKTIQDGINNNNYGAKTIIVKPGIYTGSGNYNIFAQLKTIKLYSVSGPDNTIIDCKGNGYGFYFKQCVLEIKGLTIRNCVAIRRTLPYSAGDTPNSGRFGGAFYLHQLTAIFTDMKIRENDAEYGGAIFSYQATLVFRNSNIYRNCASERGGGIYFFQGSTSIENTILSCNDADDAGGIYNYQTSTNIILQSKISNNDATSIANEYYCQSASVSIDSGYGNAMIFDNNIGSWNINEITYCDQCQIWGNGQNFCVSTVVNKTIPIISIGVAIICCLVIFGLICIIYKIYYMSNNNKYDYDPVKYIDSEEFDESEINAININ